MSAADVRAGRAPDASWPQANLCNFAGTGALHPVTAWSAAPRGRCRSAISSTWHRRRLEAGVEPAFSVEAFKTAAQALRIAPGYDMLILDGPARASVATLEIARQAALVIQPTSASVDDLHPAVLTFHEMVREGIPRARLVFCLFKIGTDAEEAEARAYIAQAGFDALAGSILERPAYRQAQNVGLTITETRFPQLNRRADELLQNVVDRIHG